MLICGPQWIPIEYYDYHYRPRIQQHIDEGCTFIVGGANGVDMFAQQQLASAKLDATRVTVYNKGTKDGRVVFGFGLENGFTTYPQRDVAMAKKASDIVCVLPQLGGGQSGCIVPVLYDVDNPSVNAEAILSKIRSFSEQYDSVLFEKIAAVYAAHYKEKLEDSLHKKMKYEST